MENPELRTAWEIIANTDTHLFLTGKAGTGKTTFLRDLREKLPKRMVVLAPTGIAAINAQGVTIHSFFQLNFGPQIPGTMQQNKRFQFRKQKVQLIRSLDLIVIDEISMVRADVLDAIDDVLRRYRDHSRPFGGVQMLMIGDMQQLAPVAKEDEWRLLSPHYATPYFFSSKALQSTDFVTVELKHVYRQNDPVFLDILNKVRTNTADDATLKRLNERYIPDFSPRNEEGYIRLMTHNYQADAVNRQKLEELDTLPYNYEAAVEGDFPEMAYPTEKDLMLKTGAQVMFVKNDSSIQKAFYNGMLGEVVEMTDKVITVRSLDGGDIIEVGHERWENTKYSLDDNTKEIKEEVVGTFSQFPLKAAWAITIHKSQGLTFEHAIIDVQHSFAHGQTYVALSRCKTLEGMVLSAPIPRSAIINDQTVSAFRNDPRHQEPNAEQLTQMQRMYLLRTVEELFSFTTIRYKFTDMIRLMREHFYSSHTEQYSAWLEAAEKLKGPEEVARKFKVQYQNIILTSEDYKTNALLQERLQKGATYFSQEMQFIWTLLQTTNIATNNKVLRERIDNMLQGLKDDYKIKSLLLKYVEENGLHIKDYLERKAKVTLSVDDSEDAKPKRSTKAGTRKSASKRQNTSSLPKSEDGDVGTDDSLLPY